MNEYSPTIGLEIHAELKTVTKMFCNSKNNPNERKPNVNICPVCMGYPGTLPVINKEAVRHVLMVGTALGGELADFTEFDRKNYFYPDIPKGYQISQYKYPLVLGGLLNNVAITRIHLEEDTARSTHDKHNESLVDFNRAGIPLMELVTEPVIKSAKEAGDFARELQLLLRYLGASDAHMEKGEMRVEANISVSKTSDFGTKVEVKNLNSFKVVEKAITYEVARQIKVLEEGGNITQETRGWDENKQITFSQRKKESSHDYRYFPDPDLPKLKISEVSEFQNLELPELPWEKRERYKKEFGIKDEDIEIYIKDKNLSRFSEEVFKKFLKNKETLKTASNHIIKDIVGMIKYSGDESEGSVEYPTFLLGVEESAKAFSELIRLRVEGSLSSNGATIVIKKLMRGRGYDINEIINEEGLLQKSNEDDLKIVVEKIIKENPKIVEDFRKGNEKVLQFLVGQGMKETKGSGNPQVLAKLFKELI